MRLDDKRSQVRVRAERVQSLTAIRGEKLLLSEKITITEKVIVINNNNKKKLLLLITITK